MFDPSSPKPLRWMLRRTDQPTVAVLVVLALAATVGWWAVQGGFHRNRLIEVDRAEPIAARFEVDFNKADVPELMQLPGIGPALAQRIVESRKTDGPFSGLEDLRRVRGIGPKTLEQIRPYLTGKQ
jgi:competence protein ComEA